MGGRLVNLGAEVGVLIGLNENNVFGGATERSQIAQAGGEGGRSRVSSHVRTTVQINNAFAY